MANTSEDVRALAQLLQEHEDAEYPPPGGEVRPLSPQSQQLARWLVERGTRVLGARFFPVEAGAGSPAPSPAFSISAASWDALRGAIEALVTALPDDVVTGLPEVRMLDETLTAILEAERAPAVPQPSAQRGRAPRT